MARFKNKVDIEYIELINRQIHYQGTDVAFLPSELNNSYFHFKKRTEAKRENEFCIKADKLYRLVLNSDHTKGCYLFSFDCPTGICRDFIFIKKEKDKWFFVESYPSWIIDEW